MSWATHLLAASAGACLGLMIAALVTVNRDRSREAALEDLCQDMHAQLDADDRYLAELAGRIDAVECLREPGMTDPQAPYFAERMEELGVRP